MSESRLRIVVTGLAATYPFGGVFWDYIQYALGFLRLGHDVLYLEDTGAWCYDPAAETFVAEGTQNAAALARAIAALEPALSDRWFFRDATGATYGRRWAEVASYCRSADLFLNVSASCWMRDEYFSAARVAFIDSDPMYTQASVPDYVAGSADAAARKRVDLLREHDVFFTFAENIGAPECRIPRDLFDWIPTRQPIVLDCFASAVVPASARRPVLTTVGSWEPTQPPKVVSGVEYGGKNIEFERFIGMPARSPLPLEIAISGRPPVERLRALGWSLVNAYSVSRDPWVYRDYLARSAAEWSVAKNAYVASRSGWFSCRTACYLALGVPAIVQDTGFGAAIPTGEGVLPFGTMEEAAGAIESVRADPARHSAAALAIAAESFDARKVLSTLIDDAMQEPAPVHASRAIER